MKIKRLIVRKTQPSKEIIRDITFNLKELNLIVDNTPEDLIESGNSVGKSTTIKIMDLYLRGKKYIFDESYNQQEFWNELMELLFNLSEPNPTFR